MSAADINLVAMTAGAGTLKVTGRAQLDSIRVQARACATSRALLQEVDLATRREDGTARIEASVPRRTMLNLTVEVPEVTGLEISDSSGDTEIGNVDQLSIEDDSGELVVEDIAGNVYVEDDSGDTEISRVGGRVSVRDDSGDLQIEEVGGDVLIYSDGSGDIQVSDIGGDFIVEEDGSGSIDYRRIDGSVRLP